MPRLSTRSTGPTRLALAVAALLVLAGCTSDDLKSPSEVASPSPSTRQQQVIVAMLAADDAQSTMSAQQRAVLLEILASGVVTFEQYQQAVTNTLECATDAGLIIDGPRPVTIGGQARLQWGWRDPAQPEGDVTLGEFCQLTHSMGVEQAYLNTDVAVENERRQLEEWRPAIVECFADQGAPLADTAMDIFDMLNGVDQLAGDSASAVSACINDLGITVDA